MGRLFLLQKKEKKWCEKFRQRAMYSFVMFLLKIAWKRDMDKLSIFCMQKM